MSELQITIAIVGGFLAGSINTLAGNGSAITLTILTEVLGLPGNLANGTNRVGVLTQGIAGTTAFYRNGKLDLQNPQIKLLTISVVIGSLLGVWVAVSVDSDQFKTVFKYIMVVMLFVILVKPKRWLKEQSEVAKIPLYISIPLFLALGFYGGFIQMGMGVFFLATLVLVAKFNIIEGNAVKTFVVTLYTMIIIGVFHYQGLIDWKIGGILAIGQTAGGYLTAHYASKYKGTEIWAYRLLVVVVVFAILRLFGAF